MIARWLELNNPGDTNVTWRDANEGENKLDDKDNDKNIVFYQYTFKY